MVPRLPVTRVCGGGVLAALGPHNFTRAEAREGGLSVFLT